MNTKSNDPQNIKNAFDQLFNNVTDQEKTESEARLIMFRFLDLIERKREMLGWNKKQLAEKMGTSASYITQLFRGDKLINMVMLAKFQKVLGLEFEIGEKKSYEDSVKDYSPVGDGKGFWIYKKFGKPDYNTNEALPEIPENLPSKVA